MNWKQQTINTYNKSAKELTEYFRGIGSREKHIDLAIRLAGTPINPRVLEIGCGDGRDAREVIKRTRNYTGFDVSEELIGIARDYVPSAEFEIADAIDYKYPNGLDVVLAFASLLHLDKRDVKSVLQKVHKALKPGGVFMISLKLADSYKEQVKEDNFGSRMFYFYNPNVIEELAGPGYEVASCTSDFKAANKSKWFEIALRKKLA